MKTTRQRCNFARRLVELARWERDTRRTLPYSAGYILAVEDRGGWVDLVTGAVHLAAQRRLYPTAAGRRMVRKGVQRGR